MFHLIDGYNLVLGSGLVRTLSGPGNLERARQRLLGWLASRLDESERARATVVFDAKPHTVAKKEIWESGLRVLFAVDHPDADSCLEELILHHSAPKQLVVVSSDQRLQAAAKRRRAQAISSQDWFEQVEHRFRQPKPITPADEKPLVGNPDPLVSEFDTAEIQRLIDEETAGNQ